MLPPGGPKIDGVRRIAVPRANGLGDFVVALPALAALRAAYPRASITYLGLPWHRTLLPGRPGPWDRLIVVPPCPGVSCAPEQDARVDSRWCSGSWSGSGRKATTSPCSCTAAVGIRIRSSTRI